MIRKIGYIALSVLLAVAMYYLYILAIPVIEYYSWTHSKVDKSINEGNKIIVAIELYQRDNGSLPDNLNDLTPKYISSIPEPYVPPYKWEYKIIDDTIFNLTVSWEGYPICFYRSDEQEWRRDGVPW